MIAGSWFTVSGWSSLISNDSLNIFCCEENLIKNCFNKWKIETKRLPKYNKNENKLHLKENVEKSTKTSGKEHRRLKGQHVGLKKEAELLFKNRPKWHRSDVNKGIIWLISRKTCLSRLTNFGVLSDEKIQLQFIVLLTKIRCEVLCSDRFIRTLQNVFSMNCQSKSKFM